VRCLRPLSSAARRRDRGRLGLPATLDADVTSGEVVLQKMDAEGFDGVGPQVTVSCRRQRSVELATRPGVFMERGGGQP
jgi:hypothetical protein